MKKWFIKIFASIFLWAFLIFLGIISIIPPFFQKFSAKVIKKEHQTYYTTQHADINNDGKIKKISLFELNNFTAVNFYDQNGASISQFNFEKKLAPFKIFWVNDYNHNKIKEIYFFTQSNDSIFLNIKEGIDEKMLVKDKFCTKVLKNHKNSYDINTMNLMPSHDLNNDGYNEFYFFLSAGYSYAPRAIFAYDIKNDTLYKTENVGNFITIWNFEDFKNQKLLIPTTIATENYKKQKHSHISYPDTSAWLMVFNEKLQFLFPPVEFQGKFQINSTIFSQKDSAFIAVLSVNLRTKTQISKLSLFNMKGKMLRNTILETNNYHLFKEYDKKPNEIRLLSVDGNVFVFDKNLILKEKYQLFDFKNNLILEFHYFDIDSDGEIEKIIVTENSLEIFRNDFSQKVSLALEEIGFAMPSIIEKNENSTKIRFQCMNNQSSYIIEYSKNPHFYFRYFIYIGIYLVILLILYLTQVLRMRKLKADNIRLQKIVDRRTNELKEKNQILEQQKEEISVQAENLRSTLEKLQQLDEFKQGLTSMIVHDLKNPLNFILNSQENQFARIKNAGKQMLNMVLNILDVQKFEEAKVFLEKINISLNEIIKESIFQTEFLAKQKNIEIKNEIFDNFVIRIDKELIIRVFVNLFTNAIKYTHIGGTIILKAKNVSENHLEISISDNGDGIPEDKIDKVFEKFEQIAAKASGNIRSTGLGLTFCKLAMEAHNGNISVKSKLNEGTTFFLIFPKIEFFEKDKFSENREITESEKSIFSDFSEKEKNLLKPYLTELQKFEVYETTEIENILENINFENSKNIEKWKNKIAETLYNLDNKNYFKLIKL